MLVRVKYIGAYAGTSSITGKNYEPGMEYEESDAVAAQLLASGQFEKVVGITKKAEVK